MDLTSSWAAGGSTSSASRIKTHSNEKGRFSRAQFFFLGHRPLNSNCTTVAPNFTAISLDRSVLFESTTKTSAAHAMDARQRGRLASSFLIGTRNATGTLELAMSGV